MAVNVWVDDSKPMPEYQYDVWIRSYDEYLNFIKTNDEQIHIFDLEYDLGPGFSGYDIIKNMVREYPEKYPNVVKCHSSNQTGRECIVRYDNFFRSFQKKFTVVN